MPKFPNTEHEAILTMCSRLHNLSRCEVATVRSASLRMAPDTDLGTRYGRVIVPLDERGSVTIAYAKPNGLGCAMIKRGGTPTLRLFRLLCDDDVSLLTKPETEALDRCYVESEEPSGDPRVIYEKIESADKRSVTWVTDRETGLSVVGIWSSDNVDEYVMQLWNAEHHEERTATIHVMYWSPLMSLNHSRRTPE